MHCWPFSILDSLDCCQPSSPQTTSRLRSRCLRTYCTSPANPLRTTVTSFCGPVLPMRPPELVRSIVPKTIRSQRIPHSPDRLLQIPHNTAQTISGAVSGGPGVDPPLTDPVSSACVGQQRETRCHRLQL